MTAVTPVLSISTAFRMALPAKSPETPFRSASVAVMVAVPSPVVVMVVLIMELPLAVVRSMLAPALIWESTMAVVMELTAMFSVAVRK